MALAAPDLTTLKARQAQTLQALLDGSTLPRAERSRRLFLLARLELELAILRGAGLDRPATTIRRLLVEDPTGSDADRAWFFLAELELRRGRASAALEALADLDRNHPRSALRCPGGLLRAEAWSGQERFDAAAASARRVRDDAGCPAAHRRQARYKLAWAELARKRFAEGARELRALAEDAGLEPSLRPRVLKDLTAAWSLSVPDADAATFLSRRGGAPLVRELAGALLARRRLAPLLLLTARSLQERANAPEASELRRLRLRALAELGSAVELERELGSGRLPPGGAEAVLLAAARLLREGRDGARLAQRLLARVAADGGSDDATRTARIELAELELAAGETEAATRQLEAARRGAAGALRARASHVLLRCLEQRATSTGDRSPRALARFAAEAWRFVREEATSEKVPQVLLALAGRLLASGDHAGAARAAEALLGRRASAAECAGALRIALHAWDRAGRHDRVFALAAAEAAKGDGGAWRAAAARAALASARAFAARRELAAALTWAERASAIDPAGPLAGEARLFGGILAARRGALGVAERVLRELAEAGAGSARPAAGRAQAALAALLETRGELAAAALIWERLARDGQGASQLDHQARAAACWLASGDRARTGVAARRLGKLLESARLAASPRLDWQRRVGELLAGVTGREAIQYLRSRARELEAERPRQTARLLLAAAEVPGAPLALLERAVELAGPVARRGELSDDAARARLALLRRARLRLARARPAARLAALQTTIPGLLELIGTRSGAVAASELEQSYALLEESLDARAPAARLAELRVLRGGLRERLAMLARREDGLEPVTLEAARARSSRWLPDLHLTAPAATPETTAVASLARTLLEAPATRRVTLARTLRLVTESALLTLGDRADLRCARALAELSLGEPASAWRELERAIVLSPADPCARRDLGVLALWRGDFARARSLLGGEGGRAVSTLGAAAAAYGLGERGVAEQLLRREEPGDPEARYLLALVLADLPARRAEAIRLLRRCVGARVETAARARQRLRELLATAGEHEPRS